jgi:hypothetical protein
MPYFICPNCKQRSIDHDGRRACSTDNRRLRPLRLRVLFARFLEDYTRRRRRKLRRLHLSKRVLRSAGACSSDGLPEQRPQGNEVSDAFGSAALFGQNPGSNSARVGVSAARPGLELRAASGRKTGAIDLLNPCLPRRRWGPWLALLPANSRKIGQTRRHTSRSGAAAWVDQAVPSIA